MSLFNELKRRNVFRVAIAYLALAWLLTEVAGTLFPAFGIPDWGVRFMVILFALGFIPALIISWVYELTPEGIKREKDVVRDVSITHVTAKRLDVFTIGLVIVALAFILADRLWLSPRLAEQPSTRAEVVTEIEQTEEPEPTEPQYPPNSIAVLPFANRSANPDDAFFVDGIHDDLLMHISRIGSIKTISRTSVMQYRDTAKSIPQIAAELGVGTVLEGGVQRAGKQVRINVQLIDARTDEHLWAEIYDRQLTATNIFAIQSEIAEAIADALKTTLSAAEQQRVRTAPTENLAAYEAFLIGRQRLARESTYSLAEAVDYFRKAVELDPGYALAWVGLADTYIEQWWLGELSKEEMIANAEAALKTALDLNEDLGEAYSSLGHLKSIQNDLEGAKRYYERALELVPNYPFLSQLYGILLEELGHWDKALLWKAAAVELDPMSAELRRSYAVSLRMAGRVEEALEQLETALEFDPDFAAAYDAIATIQWQVFNHHDKAAQGYAKLISLDPDRSSYYTFFAQLYLDLGEPDRAGLLIDRAIELAPDYYATSWGRQLLQLYNGYPESVAEDARVILADMGGWHWTSQFSAAQIRNQALANNLQSEALAVYLEHYPQLLTEAGEQIDLSNYRAAIDLALVLQEMGDREKADLLLDRADAFIREQPRLGWWGGYWVADVQILALQGKRAEALAALGKAVEEGWRSLWWYYLRHDPNLELIRDEPEFQSAIAAIEVDMAAQMQRVREMERSGEIAAIPGVVFASE